MIYCVSFIIQGDFADKSPLKTNFWGLQGTFPRRNASRAHRAPRKVLCASRWSCTPWLNQLKTLKHPLELLTNYPGKIFLQQSECSKYFLGGIEATPKNSKVTSW